MSRQKVVAIPSTPRHIGEERATRGGKPKNPGVELGKKRGAYKSKTETMLALKKQEPGTPGHPEYAPTDKQRSMVETWSAMGATHCDIANWLGISPMSVRKYFPEELQNALVRKNAVVVGALYNAAASGDVRACQYWLEQRDPRNWGSKVGAPTGPADSPMMDYSKLTVEEMRHLESMLKKCRVDVVDVVAVPAGVGK